MAGAVIRSSAGTMVREAGLVEQSESGSAGAPPRVGRLDPDLLPLVEAPDEAQARAELERLVERRALPLVREIVRSQLSRGALAEADREDVQAGALLRLSEQLWALRRPSPPEPIADLDGYVAVTAFNACHALLRQRFPELTRLRSRLRYLLTHDPALALWPGPARTLVCGLNQWRGQPAAAPEAASRQLGRWTGAHSGEFPGLVRALLRRIGAPCRFEELVDVLADVLGVSDAGRRVEPSPRDSAVDPLDGLADQAPSAERRLGWRQYLERLWQEIGLLPPRQRMALLLNLRDEGGQGVIALFPLTGVASLPDLAGALEMPQDELFRLWGELPKEDQWIAERLGLTRRQVINLRKCARERLARRLGTA